jgi:penicillin amidase
MTPAAAKRFRLLASVLSLLVVIAALGAGWFYFRLRASLPRLEGAVAMSGLAAPVKIDRDSLGVPTIRGENRHDVMRALGWLHAQDRFFQIDLLRRHGAGELVELFGKAALPLDRATRIHGFRELAQKVVAGLPAEERAGLEAYAAGVNAGLSALGAAPFEYVLLREKPQPWLPEDSVLVGYAMMLDLQGEGFRYERSLQTLKDVLGANALAFFAPLTTPNDAALDGSTAPLPPIPGPVVLDLRRVEATPAAGGKRVADPLPPGSNSFALAGRHTANGAALIADDMHLNLALPNTWYRASLEWPGHKVTGVTLPGVPMMIAGSNGRVAWGFTNANVDTSDLVIVEMAAGSTQFYTVPNQGPLQRLEERKVTLRVKGGDPVEVSYAWSIWGPIVAVGEKDRSLALRWTAHEVAALNFSLGELEDATNVREAVAVAHRAGIPAQNIVVADAAGDIAWTIAGRLPKRVGFDGRLPVSWVFGDRRWEGLRAPEEIPVDFVADTGRLWTANQRMLGGDALSLLGDGAYDRPARAAQIRDGLAAMEKAVPKDLLALQLDDRAIFLGRWQKLLLEVLSPEAIKTKSSRGELREFAAKWEGRASVESISYGLVRNFHRAVARRVLDPIFANCAEAYADFDWRRFHYEDAVWTLVHEKPVHLLSTEYRDWNALLLAAADDVSQSLRDEHRPIARATWGGENLLELRHPLSRALPEFLTAWLNAPAVPLPGDIDLPRVQRRAYGASERFVVSPSHEDEGIFEMPGGQSGHPLSPYYLAGHDAWVRGEPTPFLPGTTVHTLTLQP